MLRLEFPEFVLYVLPLFTVETGVGDERVVFDRLAFALFALSAEPHEANQKSAKRRMLRFRSFRILSP